MNRRMLISSLAFVVATPALAQTRDITRFTGLVTATNFVPFCGLVADSVDTVIGLKVHIDSPQADPRAAELEDGGSVYLFDGEELSLHADAGGSWLHGAIVFDGFYLVKYGGMHQGILSFGLQQVEEAAVVLNPDLRVVDRAL